MKLHINNVRLNLSEINLEKSISKEEAHEVLRELTFGTITTEKLLDFLSKN